MPFAGLPTALKVPGDFAEPLSKLERVSSELQRHFGVGPSESVVFERLQHGYGRYSDGIKFAIGEGNLATVLGLGCHHHKTKAIHERENVLELIA